MLGIILSATDTLKPVIPGGGRNIMLNFMYFL